MNTFHFPGKVCPLIVHSILVLLLLSCSKSTTTSNSNASRSAFESFTYTITDSTGDKRTFSDTTKMFVDSVSGNILYMINGVPQGEIAAYISPPTYSNTRKFYFDDFRSLAKTQVNKLIFYLPWYEDNLSANTGLLNSQLIIALTDAPENLYDYTSTGNYFDDGFINVKIDITEVKTEITDSTGGFVTGTFNISALTESKKPILVTGLFNHIPTNYHP